MPSTDLDFLFARTLHHDTGAEKAGGLVMPPIVPASVYHLPGDPSGPYQYGRRSNPAGLRWKMRLQSSKALR